MTTSKKMSTKEIGDGAETLAANYLIEKGYQLIQKNYRAKRGEIDLIMQKDGVTVFVEVKARRNIKFGLPQEAVTKQKQRQIIKTALYYISENDLFETDSRFDIIAVTLPARFPDGKLTALFSSRELGSQLHIEHFPAAFMATAADLEHY